MATQTWKRGTQEPGSRIALCDLPSYPSPHQKIQNFSSSPISALTLSHSSFRQASPHYRHNLFKSSTAFSPHSSVLPTTSASSSDLRSRIFVFETTPSSSAFCHTRPDSGHARWVVACYARHPHFSQSLLEFKEAEVIFDLVLFGTQVLDHAPTVVVPSRLRILGIQHAAAHRLSLASILVPPLFFAHLYSSLLASCC